MGRTNPTFRNVLEAVKSRWGDYRRALRGRDQPHFDRLFEHADAHADAAGYLNADDPMDPILVSMLLAHQRRLAALDDRLSALEGRVAALDDRIAALEDGDHECQRDGGLEHREDCRRERGGAGDRETEPAGERRR